jgi:MFS family permease
VEGAINGVFQAGGLIGALTCTWTADKFGRRKALFVGSMFATVGGALQAGSVHMAMFIITRVISGLGIGE